MPNWVVIAVAWADFAGMGTAPLSVLSVTVRRLRFALDAKLCRGGEGDLAT